MEKQIGEYPYNHYLVYGPIYHSVEERYMLNLIDIDTKHQTSTSYARYLMSVKLGRFLTNDEQVDHINGNKIDDRLENLQILSPRENRRKMYIETNMTREYAILKCPQCGTIFEIYKNQSFIGKRTIFSSCSKKCAGTLRQRLQVGETIDFSNNLVKIIRKPTVTSS